MAKAYHGAAGDDGEEGRALSAEEMLVESQLVAMGLLEPRQQMQVSGGATYRSCVPAAQLPIIVQECCVQA
jgi:hypothetical protein